MFIINYGSLFGNNGASYSGNTFEVQLENNTHSWLEKSEFK